MPSLFLLAQQKDKLWPLETWKEEAETILSVDLSVALRSSFCRVQTVAKIILHHWMEKL